MPNIGERAERPYQRLELIERDRDYGRIVCFCERVTRGELRDALAAPLPAVDLDGLRRRTRAHMGRCQGFFCGAELAALLDGQGAMTVVVVGGGPAGLAAALELRRRDTRRRAGARARGRPPAASRATRATRASACATSAARCRARPTRAATRGWPRRRAPSIRTETMVTGWSPDGPLELTGPRRPRDCSRPTR